MTQHNPLYPREKKRWVTPTGLRIASCSANPPYKPRDIFSNFLISRSRFSLDSRWIQQAGWGSDLSAVAQPG